ncbi:chromosome segregation protein SMC [Arthrobacter sp. I2-34]|uniref:Chromosome partition protein Smc n=1 Tax=Arthrobacter hankyongi TaxID=2904801 RepID=A0ABS9L6M8_9MICC|nr:chromosome segregation protein SMC [Arthrobacter hankyongi]MCG2622335.1 chromosome segregation protein SMC [Arthrobacter hankyongi]
MHLKSLTVRGFKSFASATTFDFEPGVTAVVGPNGSGKSNVVDALAWVMGEQGAKTLRGGKMEDVIFAGTAGRPALGRAHVSLTIDNADGALPIEYSEVTISRTLFRAGGSEYAINGSSCRLLDIQELLSDSGLGREMHVIVGQGQLDRVLHATPEDRRGFIEEASGILKHRRRREKTVRKLDAMQANLTRLTDLTAELRRQLTPLGKQAEVARRAQQVQFEVRDARARLLADDLVQLTSALEQEAADEAAVKARQAEVEKSLDAGRRRLAELELLAAQATPKLNAARDTWYRLSSARERFRALANLAGERHRLLGSTEPAPDPGRDPDQLEQQAAQVREEQVDLEFELEERQAVLDEAISRRADAEQASAEEDRRLTAILRAAADRREGLAKLAGQVGTARSRVEAAEAELGRLRGLITGGEERRRQAESEFAELESQAEGAEEGEESLDAAYEEAMAAVGAIEAELQDASAVRREAERERAALAARKEALEVGLDRRDGSADLLASGIDGVLAPLADLVTVKPGYEAAVAAALGAVAEAVAVRDTDTAVRALELVKHADTGRVQLVIGAGPAAAAMPLTETIDTLPAGATAAVSLVQVAGGLDTAVAGLLGAVVVVEDLRAAGQLVAEHPKLMAVTREGDVLTSCTARGGTAGGPSLIELQAAVEDTAAQLEESVARMERAKFAIAGASARLDEAKQRADAALERLNESDARIAAVAERLGSLGSLLRSAEGERERLAKLVAAAEANVLAEQQKLAEITARLAAAQDAGEAPAGEEPATERRDELAAAAVRARQTEMEARLALRSGEEQLTAISNRAASLERAAATERRARVEAAERARRRQLQAAKAAAVAQAAGQVLVWLAVSVDTAARERDRAEEVRAAWDAELATVRAAATALTEELRELTDAVHRDELARAQQRLRIDALQTRAIEELGMTAEHLVAQYGPDQPVPVAPAPAAGPRGKADKWAALRAEVDEDGNPVVDTVAFIRAEQEKRLKKAERDLAALGKVNPLALEEFAALEERHQFLSTQLEDLKASRKDLLDIIREVDERVEQVFSEAFRDTAEQFVRVFGRLFPGGEGRLVLTDPEDMLTTGIEVEARPAGKKIKRLSLLSGGERSLTAVALLVAIFKARPSPFYVMDEVEAALDDTNLGRLITIFEELRESSQLIVITHQKRTMEVADALYGVTMRGDGVSTVISQRITAASA